MATEATWAFVDRREGDSDDLIGGVEEVALSKPRANADMVQARAFYHARVARRISLQQVAETMAWTLALVSGVERGTAVPTWEEWEWLWRAIGGA